MIKLQELPLYTTSLSPAPEKLLSLCRNRKGGIFRHTPMEKGKQNVNSSQNSNGSQGLTGEQSLTLLERDFCEANVWYNLFDISSFVYDADTGTGLVDAHISLVEPAPQITLAAQVYSLQGNRLLAQIPQGKAENSAVLRLCEHFQLDASVDPDTLAVLVQAHWPGNDLTMMRELFSTGKRFVYEHQRPCKEPSAVILGKPEATPPAKYDLPPDPAHIVLSLVRYPDDLGDTDYMCGFGRIGNKPCFGMPGRGILHGPQGAIPQLTGPYAPKAMCIVMKKTGGAAVAASSDYKTDERSILFTAEGADLVYDMACSWGSPYTGPAFWQPVEYDFELKITFTYQINGIYQTNFEQRITSLEGPSLYHCLPLLVKYGCVAENTRIQMADGSLRPINTIQIGDQVAGEDRPWVVRNVWRGPEPNPMVRMELADHSTLLATQSHPVMTRKGWKRAGQVTVQDEIRIQGGGYAQLASVSLESYEKLVYNLDLWREDDSGPEDHLMFGEGFAIGDNCLQNRMEGVSL